MKLEQILVLLIVLVSCDKNIVTVPAFEAIESDRVVLLEEMTGVSCPNCPKGSAEVDAIKQLYGDQVIPVGIHGFFLSWPTKESEFDFRNEFAKQLEIALAPGTSKPAALVNRAIPSGQSSKVISSPDLWSAYVEEQLNIPPEVGIDIDITFDTTLNFVVINVGVLGLTDVEKPLKISVMILENNIIDAQEDLNEIIEEFEHNHVLRTMLTPFDGESLVPLLNASEVVKRKYEYLIPKDPQLWKVENLEIVVFVHESEESGKVLQAAIATLPF